MFPARVTSKDLAGGATDTNGWVELSKLRNGRFCEIDYLSFI